MTLQQHYSPLVTIDSNERRSVQIGSGDAHAAGESILVLGDARRGLLTTRLSQCMKSWLKEWRGAEPELDLGIRISRCDAASFATLSACDTDDLIAGQVDGVIHLAVIASPQAYQAALGVRSDVRVTAGVSTGKIGRAVIHDLSVTFAEAVVNGLRSGRWQHVSAAREPLREAVIDGKRQWWTATMEWKAGARAHRLINVVRADAAVGSR